MSTHRNIDLICVVVTVLAIVLALLFMNGERLGIQKVVDQDSESATGSVYFTNNDLNGTWESGRATVITLKGDRAAVSGSGAYVYNGDVIINGTGLFTVSGTLDDGSIVVDAHKTSKVWIKLDGARICCSDSAAFRVEQADKVFLTLAEGSENLIESGSEFSAEAVADNIKGALFSRDDLTINGSGSLTVRSGYRHAIAVNDDLVIAGGTITAEAPRDAIHANDSFRLRDAELLLKGGDEGIDVDAEGGYFYMETGSVHIDCAGDGICSEGDVLVAGGDLTIASADDGIHSGTKIYIYGGTILLSECYEGLEAIIVEQHGGDVTIYPFDDGINANGSLLNGVLTLSGMDSGEEPETYVLIAGGSLTIINSDAKDADGIDSNGSIYVTGGDVRISLPDSGTNNALDFGRENGGKARISGGTVIACGSFAMAEGFDRDSGQCSVLYNTLRGAPAGSDLALLNADGDTILYWSVPGSFSSAVLSSPEMTLGETCTVVIGSEQETITLSEVSAAFGDAQSSMFAGEMNWGGMQPSGGFGESFVPPEGSGPPEGAGRPDGTPPPEGESASAELPDIRPSPSAAAVSAGDEAAPAESAADRDTVLLMIAASCGVMIFGLIFAAVFRKKIDL